MIAHFDIQQLEPAWFEMKWRRIGGTRSGGLLVDSDTLLVEMLSEHLEEFEMSEDDFQNSDMERGGFLEPEARQQLIEYTGIDFKQCGWLQSELIPIIGISPDGISEDLTQAAEIKCPAKKRHTDTLYRGAIPKDNIHQCIHYFTVNQKLENLYFCSFRPESKYPLFVKKLNRFDEVDLGWKKKMTIKTKTPKLGNDTTKEITVPDIRTVNDWSKLCRANAILLQEQIKSSLLKLEF